MLYACDGRWWRVNRPQAGQPAPALWVTQDIRAHERYGVHHVPSHPLPGLCRAPWEIHQGLNSGYQALNLAYHFGAERVLLVGFDMQRTGGKSHWFGDHKGELKVPSPLEEFAKRFTPLAKDLETEGMRVINCSLETALTCFARGSIFDELERK